MRNRNIKNCKAKKYLNFEIFIITILKIKKNRLVVKIILLREKDRKDIIQITIYEC